MISRKILPKRIGVFIHKFIVLSYYVLHEYFDYLFEIRHSLVDISL